jgi:hypothetical protein
MIVHILNFLAIDSSLINPTTINAMMELNKKPLSSFEYIVSESTHEKGFGFFEEVKVTL